MSLNKGIGMELEQMGYVAVFAALLIPGFLWISKASKGRSMIVRTLIVGGVMVSAAVLEGSMDRAANSAGDLLEGND